ncbi:hypothetical protein NEOKW01_1308 [Nematocida sp. AWRm80]|nr:hypothetical protein NEOKW01_1308 [Nematocida sp. AWRm80]
MRKTQEKINLENEAFEDTFKPNSIIEDGNSISMYKDDNGQTVFKIENLLGAMERIPDKIDSIISVKNIGSSKEQEKKYLPENKCVLCDQILPENSFTLFCGDCLIVEKTPSDWL